MGAWQVTSQNQETFEEAGLSLAYPVQRHPFSLPLVGVGDGNSARDD